MRRRRRHILGIVGTALVAVVAGVAAIVGAAAGDRERVGEMQIFARLGDRGLAVTEVIDYDFGYQQRHGIYRDIPDLVDGGEVTVLSPTAPDQALITSGIYDTNVRVGSPTETIWQRHRYQISYTLDATALFEPDCDLSCLFSWDAVGNEWTVGMEKVTVHLALDNADITAIDCQMGNPWDSRSCPVSSDADGRITVEIDDLDAGDAVTISAAVGDQGATIDLPPVPTGNADDPGTGVIPPLLYALGAAAVASIPARLLTRRAGREQVWEGGAADAAYGDADDAMPVTRMSERELSELTTIEFEPPRGMSAVEGGLILDEAVHSRHKAAWLLEAAIREEITLEGEEKPEMRRGSAPSAATVGPILDRMFGGRSTVKLGTYDKDFTRGWTMLSGTLDDWADGADHWDRAGHRRQNIVRVIAVVAGLAGLAVAGFGGAVANTSGSSRLWLVAVGAAIAGGAGAALANSWELLIRTPKGSALWLRIESFRRFLHDSEARHVTEAAERGVLRQYTAWAIALDEADAWTDAVEDAVGSDPDLSPTIGRDLAFVTMGSHLGHATSSAATKPSSSGGSGGFGGGAGGGGGGGGGGSW